MIFISSKKNSLPGYKNNTDQNIGAKQRFDLIQNQINFQIDLYCFISMGIKIIIIVVPLFCKKIT